MTLIDLCSELIPNGDRDFVLELIHDADLCARYDLDNGVYLAYVKVIEQYLKQDVIGQFRLAALEWWNHCEANMNKENFN